MRTKEENWKRMAFRILCVMVGTAISAFNISSFVHHAGLIPGGFTGLSLLIQESVQKFIGIEIPYSFIHLPLNFLPAFLGIRFLGRNFTLLSCMSIFLSSILVDLLPPLYFTDDMLLLSIFGGILNGVGMSVCLRGNATTGGTDIISIFISERLGRDGFTYILGGNVVVLSVAGMLLGWDKAMYSVIFQFVTTQTLHLLFKRYQRNTLYIITDKTDEIYQLISQETHHDATLFKGVGCYRGQERRMLYSVVSGDEIHRLLPKIRETDPQAFVNVAKSERIWGRFYQKPND